MTTNGPPNGAAPPSQTANALIYPALHLFPLNDTFVPKQILLAPPGERIKIGRQTNAKTVPNSTNGYFDSKVLSRMHAEVWCEEAKVYIKDVKSSNGTFINGDRLSAEGVESDVFELHSDDIVVRGSLRRASADRAGIRHRHCQRRQQDDHPSQGGRQGSSRLHRRGCVDDEQVRAAPKRAD